MNSEHTWRMRVAHWFATIIGASLVATVVFILLTGAPFSAFAVVAIAALLAMLVAYIAVGAKFLSEQPSPDATSAHTIRLVGWLVVAAVVILAAVTLLPLLLVDNSIMQIMPGGTALIILLIAIALSLVVLAVALSQWLGSLKDLERGYDSGG